MIGSPPKLDDRTFRQLVDVAVARIRQECPEWTDFRAGDPGIVILEAFAYLTGVMLNRLNRLPEKAYIEFLRLMGVRLQPPFAASVTLHFSLAVPVARPVNIPRGTRVTTGRSQGSAEPPTFSTMRDVTIKPGETSVDVVGYHGQLVSWEAAGQGTGLPRHYVRVARPPIVAPTGDELDLVVGVEALENEVDPADRAVQVGSKTFRIWREVENFANRAPHEAVYVADRLSGLIMFAPDLQLHGGGDDAADVIALGAVPGAGRQIVVSYLTGGGVDGNVAAGSLTVLRDPFNGLQVTNLEPATGGRAGETLENAMIRGPKELHSLQRAVTAQDYELVAQRVSGAIDRANAFTEAMLWKHARPGSVLVLLVPHVPLAARDNGRVGADQLVAHQKEDDRARVLSALDERCTLGTLCRVNWTRYKSVQIETRIVVAREENKAAVRDRVLARLYQRINPCPSPPGWSGWRYGEALRDWHVYELIRSEPGVQYVDSIRLSVESAPEKHVYALASDAFQPRTFYAATEHLLFRTSNGGDGWELINEFPGETVTVLRCSTRESGSGPHRAGLVVVATKMAPPEERSRVHVTTDCGETWRMLGQMDFAIEDVALLFRDGEPILLLATDAGLFEITLRDDAVPLQILVDPANQGLGFRVIAISTDVSGITRVAVATCGDKGVWLSHQGGRRETFHKIGLEGEMVRRLAVQHDGPHAYLWAGIYEAGEGAGKGCFRYRLTASSDLVLGWEPFGTRWQGGSCRSLTFHGRTVVAGTRLAGVVWLDPTTADPAWNVPEIGCGLPLRTASGLHPIDAVAGTADGSLVLASGIEGIYRAARPDGRYEKCSRKTYEDRVTIPATWLFCSGCHDVQVLSEDETN
ncbi:MAG: baseplate J/gp47 family protein [Rhodospirillales bacterium]|nr:baseplate J/gp47 family protein [Rhodospirillales bacterium]